MDDALWQSVDEIPGWLTRDEADLLLHHCNGNWCEVGSYKGRSATVLSSSGYPGWCVDVDEFDPPKNVLFLRGHYRKVYDLVPTLSLLHLDADHSYEATKEAFDLYAPKVKYGGHVVFHDAWPHEGYLPYPGVTRFVVELFDDKKWQLVRCVDRSACFLKD